MTHFILVCIKDYTVYREPVVHLILVLLRFFYPGTVQIGVQGQTNPKTLAAMFNSALTC